MWRQRLFAVCCFGVVLGHPVLAQSLTVHGLGPSPVVVERGALEKLGLVDLKDAREVTSGGVAQRQETTYSGIELPRLLDSLGFDKLDRHAVRAASITVEARDAYKASFSWGELYNTSAGPNVLLILKVNGSPLPERAGAFSLRAFSDLRPGPRHVRDVTTLRLIFN
jgi:hypothetical protein